MPHNGGVSRRLMTFVLALAVALTVVVGGALALGTNQDPAHRAARAARGHTASPAMPGPRGGRPAFHMRERITAKQWAAKRDALFAGVGKELGLSGAMVKAGMRAVLVDRLDRRLKKGLITPAQRAALLAGFEAGLPGVGSVGIPFIAGRGRFAGPPGGRALGHFKHRFRERRGNRAQHRRPRLQNLFAQLARKLDRTPQDVRKAARAVLAAQIAAQVNAGRLPARARDRMLERFDRRAG
jgi:hypothetical protein